MAVVFHWCNVLLNLDGWFSKRLNGFDFMHQSCPHSCNVCILWCYKYNFLKANYPAGSASKYDHCHVAYTNDLIEYAMMCYDIECLVLQLTT
jgi:hypothetical protein